MKPAVNIFWFRRDLRLDDNAALYHALKQDRPLVPIFIFDRNILDELEDKTDRRVAFIHQQLQELQKKLEDVSATIEIRYGFPLEVFKELLQEYEVGKVFTNGDYEPYAIQRDAAVAKLLEQAGISFHSYKDQVIFEKDEIVKDDGNPYTVFTPYSRKWKSVLSGLKLAGYATQGLFGNFFRQSPKNIPSLSSMGFSETPGSFPAKQADASIIINYSQERDIPAADATSKLGIHLRFGTISIRKLVTDALALNETFLNELIWREFFQAILWHYPQVVDHSFKAGYDNIQWRNNEKEFEAWCKGCTGYPIVDAGMRQLNETGFMHNRVRMITASFLCKHLLIDWRWGEAYFARQLLDYNLASNNGNWQWAAGCGCDAAPYFRIFNPALQTKKFDPDLVYIRRWVTDLDELSYPTPIVEHEFARKRCLETYARALKK